MIILCNFYGFRNLQKFKKYLMGVISQETTKTFQIIHQIHRRRTSSKDSLQTSQRKSFRVFI